MSIKPEGVIDYGQYGATERRIPTGGFANGSYINGLPAPKPADSITISLEFLRGVEAAAQWAHDEWSEPTSSEIIDAVVSNEVTRLREEAA